ncbi:MAG: 30S ribosomal protein S16, partial [Gammaproteobacteria bacterium]|nr:30S ribosomal protein S16 [Gammaproteobacteria bacterium]
MLTIRLARSGSKKRPFFHITIADSRRARDGKFIERVGYFNPISRGKEVRLEINKERVDYWIDQGAQLSGRVESLIKEFNETDEEKQKRELKKEKRKVRKALKRAASKVGDEASKAPAEEAKEEAKEEAPAEEAPAEEAKEEAPAEEAKE